MNKELSNCCNANCIVAGDTTRYVICSDCKEPCSTDIEKTLKQHIKEENEFMVDKLEKAFTAPVTGEYNITPSEVQLNVEMREMNDALDEAYIQGVDKAIHILTDTGLKGNTLIERTWLVREYRNSLDK